MGGASLKDLIKNPRVKDYTYAIFFFIVSAFFMFFVIRPVLSIAFSIRRQVVDLERINKVYSENISHILLLQDQLESIRPRKYLLDEAIPDKPNIVGVIEDMQRASAESGVPVTILNVEGLEFIDGVPADDGTILVTMNIVATFESMNKLFDALTNQRRIKKINSIAIKRTTSEESFVLNVSLEIETYYNI